MHPLPESLRPTAERLFADRLELAERFVELLAEQGPERGLIGPREVDRLWERHLLNCALMVDAIDALDHPATTLADVGSGAGLPGVVIAIARPDLQVTLIEMASVLQDSGIGHISIWDSHRVIASDVGTGLREADIGTIRSLATAAVLNPKHQRPRIHPAGSVRQPPLTTLATVHITLGRWDTATIRQAKELKHPYLPVVIRDDEIDVGPWVAHKAAACPLCLDNTSVDTDIHNQRDISALDGRTGGIETVAGAHLVAGLIATEILSMVDSQHLRHRVPMTKYGMVPGVNLNTFTRIHLANGWIQTFEVSPLRDCCAAAQELKIASTSAP